MKEAVVVSAVRTPIGRARKGSLAAERPDDMLAFAIGQAVRQAAGLEPALIEDVMVGCAIPEQMQGDNVARRAGLLAGLPVDVPGTTVARYCASSLQAARMAFHAIRSEEGDAFVVGGVESISLLDRERSQDDDQHPELGGHSPPLPDVYLPMGITAENVADRYGVSREEMDRYAQRSQERAVAAQRGGFFGREIAPYTKADGSVISDDDGPRPSSTYEALSALDPVFRGDGRVTAGNACPLNDGAAALVVLSGGLARDYGLEPIARIVSTGVSGVQPELMGVGPIEAVESALARGRATINDVDVFELNEAFAAQVIPVCREVGIDPFDDRVNPHGGAIALGHPYGMTGARMLCTLMNGLQARDGTLGVASMCVAGGQGMAMVLERTA